MAKHSFFSITKTVESAAPAQDFLSAVDDFSIKVSSSSDARFWIRLEREVEHDTLVVTDFNKGDLTIEDVEAGLVTAVRTLGRKNILRMLFRDIIPGGDQTPNYPTEIVKGADLVKRLGRAVAADLQTDVKAFDLQPRRNKIDGLVTFGVAPA